MKDLLNALKKSKVNELDESINQLDDQLDLLDHLNKYTSFTDEQIFFLLDKKVGISDIETLSNTLRSADRIINRIENRAKRGRNDFNLIFKKISNYSNNSEMGLLSEIFDRASKDNPLIICISAAKIDGIYKFSPLVTEILQILYGKN